MNRRTPPIPALSRRAALVGAAQAVALLAAACASLPNTQSPQATPASSVASTSPPAAPATVAPTTAAPTAIPAATATSLAEPIELPTPGPNCPGSLAQVVAPTPIPYPGYVQVEPSTGLHVTKEPIIVELESYRLAVTGKVSKELSLTYDELRCLPKIRAYSRIECPGFFVDWSNLAGASLVSVLEMAQPLEDAKQIFFTGVDGSTSNVSLVNAQGSKYFLAYEWEGQALPASHGFPVRLALPDNPGGYWTKWLQKIEIS